MVNLYNHKMDDAAPAWADMIRMHGAVPQTEASYIDTLRLNTYPARALCITDRGDIIQLNPCLKEEVNWVLDHYKNAHVFCSENIVFDDSFEMTSELLGTQVHREMAQWCIEVGYCGYPILSPFFFGVSAHEVAANKDCLSISQKMSSKNEFIEMCRSMDVAIPTTQCFEKKEQLTCFDFSYPVYLKTDKSVGGLGVVECMTKENLIEAVDCLGENVAFQVQKKLYEKYSVSLLYFAQEGKVSRLYATQQLVEDASHVGNVFPALVEPWVVTDKVAEMMACCGIEGHFGFDVLVDDNNISYVIECNPRFTAATYPAILAKNLSCFHNMVHRENIARWESRSYATKAKSLSEIDLGGLVYTPEKGEGVVMVSWGTILQQKLSFLLIGSEKRCADFSRELTNIL